MKFDLTDFVTVPKYIGTAPIPPDTIRLTNSGISLGSKVVHLLASSDDEERLVAVIQYSEKHRALRLTKPTQMVPGYILRIDPSKGTANTNNLPQPLKLMRVPRGTYVQVEDQPEIFVLQDEGEQQQEEFSIPPIEERYASESGTVESGDVVSWAFRPRGSGTAIANGIVKNVYEYNGEQYASVVPVSTNYLEVMNITRQIKIKVINLIIREKHND
jgi:hypothetical protein